MTCQGAAGPEDTFLLLILYCAKIGKGRIIARSTMNVSFRKRISEN